jgi:hypothetical protein
MLHDDQLPIFNNFALHGWYLLSTITYDGTDGSCLTIAPGSCPGVDGPWLRVCLAFSLGFRVQGSVE